MTEHAHTGVLHDPYLVESVAAELWTRQNHIYRELTLSYKQIFFTIQMVTVPNPCIGQGSIGYSVSMDLTTSEM